MSAPTAMSKAPPVAWCSCCERASSSAPALAKTIMNMLPKVHDPEVKAAMEALHHQAESIKRNAKVNLISDIATNTKEKMIVFKM